MSARNKTKWLAIIILAVLVVDQISKIWVKTHFVLGERVEITSWFYLLFIENQGMAFGMEMFGKLFLSIFRVVAVGLLAWFLVKLVRENYRFGFVLCIALIFAGAIGNLIDSVFYGKIFSHSYGQLAELFPAAGGYAPLFYGKVVDMFYFPLFTFPEWLPLLGGDVFFSPVFNVADSAVTGGVFAILLFFRKELNRSLESKKKEGE
ncbi:MAG: lipoprotein signal peptidase [Prevotellaceae bacterium]|nr:lipoprotein signal peptidase [Prevotellaceae bacterium]